MSSSRTLSLPHATRIEATPGGAPTAVDAVPVTAVRESWLVEDRWWDDEPLRRRYWEVVTATGRNIVLFHDLVRGRWLAH